MDAGTDQRHLLDEDPNPIIGADCISYNFEDLAFSASLMKEADVLIGVHG